MKLTAYTIGNSTVTLRPAPLERAWMDATPERFAYRCLPLNIANAYGWEVLCPSGFKAIWDGEAGLEAIKIESAGDGDPPAISHFGSGVLTFHLPCIFRTAPGYDLMVQGPINRPKDGIAPLSAVVETDWAIATFTMNWLFTQPEVEIEFEAGEPFCHVFPVRRGEIESAEPELRPLSADPELQARYHAWSASRSEFNKQLKIEESKAQAEKWQKHYQRGADTDFTALAPPDHRTRLKLRSFRVRPEEDDIL
jgi:hypothetical protein